MDVKRLKHLAGVPLNENAMPPDEMKTIVDLVYKMVETNVQGAGLAQNNPDGRADMMHNIAERILHQVAVQVGDQIESTLMDNQ